MHIQPGHVSTAHSRNFRHSVIAFAAVAFSLGCAAWQSQGAYADTITVTTTIDEIQKNADCSLREAVQAANTDSAVGGCAMGNGADTIIVPAGTYTLTIAGVDDDLNLSGDLDITDTLVISGAGSTQTVIDANGLDRAVHSDNGIFTVTLAGLTIQHGSSNVGAGAWLRSPAAVTGSVFISNSSSYGGGGADFSSTATVDASAFVNNTSNYGPGGASFYGDSVIRHSVFEANISSQSEAGGAWFYGNATLVSTDFVGNSARVAAGGAVFNGESNAIVDSRFVGNVALESGGGICTAARITHCISDGGQRSVGKDYIQTGSAGGALFLGATAITRTTFLSNTAPDVGGAGFNGPARVVDSAFQHNSATSAQCNTWCAGGAYFAGTGTVTGSRFEGNRSAYGAGGARFVLAADLRQTVFHSNTAESMAGGAFFDAAALLQNVAVTSNTTRYGAGGANFVAADAAVIDSQFDGNAATGGGVPCPPTIKAICAAAQDRKFTSGANTPEGTSGGVHFGAGAAITRTTFTANTAPGVGGARFTGIARVVDSSFRGNFSTGTSEIHHSGGAFFESAALVAGTVFERNSSNRTAGGAFFQDAAAVTASTFDSNATQIGGGGAFFANTAHLSATVLTNNTAQSNGGGAYFAGITNTVDGSVFEGNIGKEGAGGGAFFVYTATVRGTRFTSNTAWSDGGALFNAYADLADTDFVSNTATGFGALETGLGAGGAGFRTMALLVNARFLANTSARSGGGASFGSSASVTNSLFLNNSSRLDGGGAFIDGGGLQWWNWDMSRGRVRMVNTLFGGNTAGNNGAAIYVHDTEGLQLLHVTIGSPRLEPNQALAVHAGTVMVTNTIIASHTIGIERSAGSVSEDYTLFSGVTTPRRGVVAVGAHSRVGNAAFVDPAGGNYHLTARSAALNGGMDAGLDLDIDGQFRRQGHGRGSDIGFDEFLQWIQILTMVWKS